MGMVFFMHVLEQVSIKRAWLLAKALMAFFMASAHLFSLPLFSLMKRRTKRGPTHEHSIPTGCFTAFSHPNGFFRTLRRATWPPARCPRRSTPSERSMVPHHVDGRSGQNRRVSTRRRPVGTGGLWRVQVRGSHHLQVAWKVKRPGRSLAGRPMNRKEGVLGTEDGMAAWRGSDDHEI